MKKIILLSISVLLFISCKKEKEKEKEIEIEQKTKKELLEPISNEILETAVIYEANIRQYSKEGTFNAFTKDIPKLKELGVKIIWLMPVFPISEKKRKATGGKNSKFVSDFPKEEQGKYLGSYYAVSDFKKINPEFGTIEDFRTLLKTAHANKMYVILDWVPNHTGWDHTWLTTNPDFYTKNDQGEVIHPKGTDWTDVADLNYENEDLRKQMISDMNYWVVEENIDGFRCDMAGMVPISFWEKAIPELRAKKDIFMLAEAWEPELLKNNLFNMGYGWDRHHTMNAIAKGEKKGKEWEEVIQKDNDRYRKDAILMNFMTNHDENSWNGTIQERMGDASELFTTLTYLSPGMPLIYSGQEYGLNHRLKFFEKDSITKVKGKEWELLKKLGVLKKSNKALHTGKIPATYSKIITNNKEVLAFERKKDTNSVLFIGNLSKKQQIIHWKKEGAYKNYFKGAKMSSKPTLTLEPYEYLVLVN